VPIEQAKPGAPAQPAKASKPGGKGAKKGLRGILDYVPKITPSVGVTSQKTYIAQHSLDNSDAKTHGLDENARIANEYSITGGRKVNNSETQQSSQQDRLGRDASRNTVNERSNVQDVSSRVDYSVTDKASRSRSDNFSIQRDLTADPHFLEKVAQRNGMTAARFAGQEEGRQWQMIIDYAAEKGAMQASTTMPSSSFAGAKIPLNSTDLEQTKKEEESKLPDNIDAIHRDNVRRTGLSGVAPVKTDTTLPAIATANEALVNAQLEPTVLGSIPERAAAFDEHVRAWASADKPIGEARENPLRVVEDMVARLSLGAGCSRLRSGSGAGVAAQRTYPIALQLRDYSGRVI
jgi:conjugal transfer mating pair stabilization protein TraG